jgi:hypothetical protein
MVNPGDVKIGQDLRQLKVPFAAWSNLAVHLFFYAARIKAA